jgi:hypothetical protein
MPLKKIAYLFGAGATHAEILTLEESPSETFISKNGLLISNVSKRVMKQAQNLRGFKNNVEFVTSPEGSLNIELLISLFETNRIPNSENKIRGLKQLVQKDIISRLSPTRKRKFYLHKALLELHSLIEEREILTGIISLNYDDIIDDAYITIRQKKPNYCHTSERETQGDFPLLKLHGSFNWTNIRTYGKTKAIPIIPLGINKNYLIPPYNFIWSRAFEVLAHCDILRVIGCSLNQNDIGLIDLLFKAHLERNGYFELQIIDFQKQGDQVKNNYGFFPGIIKPKDIENSLIADDQILKEDGTGNPFKIWLRAKSERMVSENIDQTRYLKKCL